MEDTKDYSITVTIKKDDEELLTDALVNISGRTADSLRVKIQNLLKENNSEL